MPKEKKKLPSGESTTTEVIQEVEETDEKVIKQEFKEVVKTFDKESWNPKSAVGKKVKSGEITDIKQIIDTGQRILETAITDCLLPDLSMELLFIGQAKGKFGGGQRRVFRQVQKKTKEGNKPKFATLIIVGNQNGYFGMGYGKSKETVPAREKGLRNAKLNIIKIRRGCGSWQCGCKEPHSIPFAVYGKCGSVEVRLMPAPKGTGLRIEGECAKILKLAGIKDVWSKTLGHTTTKMNMIYACVAALRKLMDTKIKPEHIEPLGIIEGSVEKKEPVFETVEEKESNE
jgi:small subunit ribosomal protein S5